MLRAFRYDLATTPQLLHISVPDGMSESQRHDVSATLAGLVQVRSVHRDSYVVHPTTGEVTYEEPVDPLNGEHAASSETDAKAP